MVCGAVETAAAAVAAGSAKYVVVYRSLAQGQTGRFGQAATTPTVGGARAFTAPYGLTSPAQMVALRTRRFMHEHGLDGEPMAAIALTCYAHAQRNPRAVMHGRPLTREAYDNSRWVVEPFHLFDCCQENDGAAAVILTSAERARDGRPKPAYVMAASQGTGDRFSLTTHSSPVYATANFGRVAPRLFERAGITPADVDVAQFYENFTGGVMMAISEFGFCEPQGLAEFCTEANLRWSGGKLPLNTSGGNLAECYMHGLELVNEAVRQVRGTSTSQVEGAEIALVAGGPATSPVSSLLLHG
jgi:acetyl-CoA acetyltransferase